MKEQDIKVFISCVKNYFLEFDHSASLDFLQPIVLSGIGATSISKYILKYTATISISGAYNGAIYVSIDEEMLSNLVRLILDSEEVNREDLVDMAGEIVNTIAGNARRELGADFNISVPFVISGATINIDLPKMIAPIYILPCKWNKQIFYLFLGLDPAL
ncbi:MAG: chemotaxis protein CheX [Sulfurimonas sp.]|nr:chemotaxis protein CheX [Sulfurimonas sp.]